MVGENCLHPGCAQLIYLRLALVMCVWFASLINPASCSETFPVEKQRQPQVNQVRTSKQMSPALCTADKMKANRWESFVEPEFRRTSLKVLALVQSNWQGQTFWPCPSTAHHCDPLQSILLPAPKIQLPPANMQHSAFSASDNLLWHLAVNMLSDI